MQAIKNAPAMREHQQGTQVNSHYYLTTLRRYVQPEIIFTEGQLCSYCKLGHYGQVHYRQIKTGEYYNAKTCDRCGTKCGFYTKEPIRKAIREKREEAVPDPPPSFKIDHGTSLQQGIRKRSRAQLLDMKARENLLYEFNVLAIEKGYSNQSIAEKLGLKPYQVAYARTKKKHIPGWDFLDKLFKAIGVEKNLKEVAKCN